MQNEYVNYKKEAEAELQNKLIDLANELSILRVQNDILKANDAEEKEKVRRESEKLGV